MGKRIFTAAEIAKLLTSQEGSDIELSLGNGLKAIRMGKGDDGPPIFTMERNGKGEGFGLNHRLEDADAAELAELSAIVWAFADQFGPSAVLEDELTPDALADKPEPEGIEPDPLGLTPDRLREIIADPALARRLATGTATKDETLDTLLTPDSIMRPGAGEGDPLSYPGDEKGEL
jgi:hypothetical protein